MPGYHLPFLAGAANGLFAERGIDLAILEPAGGPANAKDVAAGGAEFCLTSVEYYLRARAENDDLAARFVAMITQRSPMAALVAEDSDIREPADLADRRLAGTVDNHLVVNYQATMVSIGLKPSRLVATAYADAGAALARGEVDAVADFVDLIPRLRRQSGIAVRAVPFATDIYGSGLVGADRLSPDLVGRMRSAVVASLELQRSDPKVGLGELVKRYPNVNIEDALEGWYLAEPNIFTDVPPGSMDPARWERTVAHVATSFELPHPDSATLYRPEHLLAASSS